MATKTELEKKLREISDLLEKEIEKNVQAEAKIKKLEECYCLLEKKAAEQEANDLCDCVVLNGVRHEIMGVELASEINRRILRSELEENVTVVVIDRHGA